MLQIGVLTCVTSSFSLLLLLRPVINACYKCIMYLRFIHYLNDEADIFWTHRFPTYSYLHQCDKIGIILKFCLLVCRVFSFIMRWCCIYPVTHVGLRLLRHTMKPSLRFPTHTSHQTFLPDFPYFSLFLLHFLCVYFLQLSFSFLPLEILVSLFLQNSFVFLFFMVDYSLVKLDCPSISFFLAHLCSFLVSGGGGCP